MHKQIENIHMKYLEAEIIKMQKTAEGLEKMLEEKKKDTDFVNTLQKIHLTTLKNIENKKRELKTLYDKEVEVENN